MMYINPLAFYFLIFPKLYQYLSVKKEEERIKLRGERPSAEWGSQIRSYTFQPYTLVKDHRTGVETSNVHAVMDGDIDNFILWSGDSDFADPIQQLVDDNKKVMIFAVARRVSVELGQSQAGIFDIRKIKEFICRSKELSSEITADFKNKLL